MSTHFNVIYYFYGNFYKSLQSIAYTVTMHMFYYYIIGFVNCPYSKIKEGKLLQQSNESVTINCIKICNEPIIRIIVLFF